MIRAVDVAISLHVIKLDDCEGDAVGDGSRCGRADNQPNAKLLP